MLKLPQLQVLQALCYQRLLLSTVFFLDFKTDDSVDQLIQKVCEDDNCNAVKAKILETEAVFIDELSMLSLKLFTDIDALCRAVRNNDTPCGGMQVILPGDFFQLKPVPNSYGDNCEYIFNLTFPQICASEST